MRYVWVGVQRLTYSRASGSAVLRRTDGEGDFNSSLKKQNA